MHHCKYVQSPERTCGTFAVWRVYVHPTISCITIIKSVSDCPRPHVPYQPQTLTCGRQRKHE